MMRMKKEVEQNESSYNCEVQSSKIREAMDIAITKVSPMSSIQSAPCAPTKHHGDYLFKCNTHDIHAKVTSAITIAALRATADPQANSRDKLADVETGKAIGVGSELEMDEWDLKKNDNDDYLDDEHTLGPCTVHLIPNNPLIIFMLIHNNRIGPLRFIYFLWHVLTCTPFIVRG